MKWTDQANAVIQIKMLMINVGFYLLCVCDVRGVCGVHADRNTRRDRCTGQEVRILVISVLDVHRQSSRRVEFLQCV